MVWTIEISAAAEQDIDLLFDHLADSYVGFGESHVAAAAHAVARIDECSASPFMGSATSLSDTEARGNKPVS